VKLEALLQEGRGDHAGRELAMRFSQQGLVLGFGTVLAPASASARDVSIDVTEPRVLALLSAAHLRSPTPGGLAHLRRAAEMWREGEDNLAAMHLALSRLDRLEHPIADAQRLFLADGLLEAGLDAATLVRALDVETPSDGQVSKYSPDQPRAPAGSGRPSGEWTTGAGSPVSAAPPTARQRPARATRHQTPGRHPPVAAPSPGPERSDELRDERLFNISLPSSIIGAVSPPDLGPFSQAVKAVADTIEVADSVTKWRELGPKGEIAVAAAVRARGWILLDMQVPIRTTLGLRIEDLMVHVPAGTAGNATAYDGFIEVKVNGGRYSLIQRAKDALIGSEGGALLRQVGQRKAGSRIILETGLANVMITYAPE
jgi:hypothetical protein